MPSASNRFPYKPGGATTSTLHPITSSPLVSLGLADDERLALGLEERKPHDPIQPFQAWPQESC